jgi:hypothetical protein|nr:MAG TPA: hypothetical protein [Caudoviricetes sp.]
MNAAVFSIFGATFPIFVIASALIVRTCGDKRMPYMAAALASMALSASIIASAGEHDMFARFFSLAAYGMAGVFMFAGATDKSWRSIDMLLLVVFVFMSSVIGGFFTRAPHSVVMPSAFVVFAGFAVMAIRYYANDKMLIALIMGVLAVVTLADSAFIGLPGPNALLVVKMALVALMEAALIVNCYMAYKARKKGKHVR